MAKRSRGTADQENFDAMTTAVAACDEDPIATISKKWDMLLRLFDLAVCQSDEIASKLEDLDEKSQVLKLDVANSQLHNAKLIDACGSEEKELLLQKDIDLKTIDQELREKDIIMRTIREDFEDMLQISREVGEELEKVKEIAEF